MHPSVLRNREPILAVLRTLLPSDAEVVEVASGSGAHAAFMTAHLPALRWLTTEHSPRSLPRLQARRQESGAPGFLPPARLDAADPDQWPIPGADAIVCINMAHISPWSATDGLLRGAARILPPGGFLYLYGPFMVDGAHTAPSNARFDTMLRSQDPSWGIRDLTALATHSAALGLTMEAPIPMPANNFSLVLRR
ncbi:MAG: SAM-dependent methyltransferase [Myxococcota bacterium]